MGIEGGGIVSKAEGSTLKREYPSLEDFRAFVEKHGENGAGYLALVNGEPFQVSKDPEGIILEKKIEKKVANTGNE